MVEAVGHAVGLIGWGVLGLVALCWLVVLALAPFAALDKFLKSIKQSHFYSDVLSPVRSLIRKVRERCGQRSTQ